MVAISGNAGSIPFIVSEVIQDRASDGVKKGSRIYGLTLNQIQTASGPRRTGSRRTGSRQTGSRRTGCPMEQRIRPLAMDQGTRVQFPVCT